MLSEKTVNYDVIVVGAGAAGLMCSIEAGKRGRKVLLIDHSKSVGEKIRISGGGRCNFTNIHTSPDNYLCNNPRFCVSALKRYPPASFIKLVNKHNISYHEKTLGQLFCDGSSKQIIKMLIDECHSARVEISLNTSINQVRKQDNIFYIKTPNSSITAKSLVVATGGLSIPKMGATGWGYDIAKSFDLDVTPTFAALVPFTLDGKTLEKLQSLSGVSVNAKVVCKEKSFIEALLFTHRGLSGPSILQISSYWKEGQEVTINLAQGVDVLSKLKQLRQSNPKQELSTILSTLLPKRLAQYICDDNGYYGKIADYSNKKLEEVTDSIIHWKITPNGTEGFRTAEVTLGGVNTNEISSKTFEAKKVPGLYFIGEVLDVTGHLGGFNFQWAWASGHAAGQFV